MKSTFLILMAVLSFGIGAQAEELTLPAMQGLGTVVHKVVETKKPDRRYHLLIRIPKSKSGQPIPVLYILDGGLLFPLFSSYYHLLNLAGELPDMVLVGVSYGTDRWQDGNQRSADFTLPAIERAHWGGAAAFANVLKTKIFPTVEAVTGSTGSQRYVFGQSLGGQFALYAAQFQPGLFAGHIASNPALHRNLDAFLEARPESSGRLLVVLADGDAERFRLPALKWRAHWQSHPSRRFQLKVLQLAGHTHLSPSPEAFRRGLLWLLDTVDAHSDS